MADKKSELDQMLDVLKRKVAANMKKVRKHQDHILTLTTDNDVLYERMEHIADLYDDEQPDTGHEGSDTPEQHHPTGIDYSDQP